jgi:hypothetical protein
MRFRTVRIRMIGIMKSSGIRRVRVVGFELGVRIGLGQRVVK